MTLNPETSKCPGSFEMCCRHPDWFGLDLSVKVPIQKPPEEGCKNEDIKGNLTRLSTIVEILKILIQNFY